jgi:TonB family protein
MATPKSPFATSLAIHTGLALLVFTTVSVQVQPPPVRKTPVTFIDVAAYHRALEAPPRAAGGGGGNRSPLPVSKGMLPKPSPRPFTPPMITESHEAQILVQPALLNEADPSLMAVKLPQWGDPLAKAGPPSNGPGTGGGMGPGDGGGVGPGSGPRFGPGSEDGTPGNSRSKLTLPQLIYQIDPEFSEEARRAKINGTVVLVVDVDTQGHPANVRILRSLGMGLDEKAMEAVLRWKFRPGRRDGKPVTVPATIEVSFHLL